MLAAALSLKNISTIFLPAFPLMGVVFYVCTGLTAVGKMLRCTARTAFAPPVVQMPGLGRVYTAIILYHILSCGFKTQKNEHIGLAEKPVRDWLLA